MRSAEAVSETCSKCPIVWGGEAQAPNKKAAVLSGWQPFLASVASYWVARRRRRHSVAAPRVRPIRLTGSGTGSAEPVMKIV